MHPKNRMEKGIALKAIADVAEEMEKSGAPKMDVAAFTSGARKKLTQMRPDLETYAKAASSAFKWNKANK